MNVHSGVSTTKEIILGAAFELFAERGFHASTMPELATRAGVGTGTIYRYFQGKEDIGNALFRYWKGRYAAEVLATIPPEGSWRARFGAFWQGMARFSQEHPGVLEYLEFHHHSSYLDEKSRAQSTASTDAVLGLISVGQAEGALIAAPPILLFAMVYGSFLRLVRMGAAGRIELTPEVWALAEERAWSMVRS